MTNEIIALVKRQHIEVLDTFIDWLEDNQDMLEVTKEFKYFPVDRYKLQMAGHNIFGWKKPEDEEMF